MRKVEALFLALVALAVCATLVLTGCDQGPHTGKRALAADDYYFEQKEYEQFDLRVFVVEVDNQAHLERVAKLYDVELPPGALGAFSLLDADRKGCRIFMIKPEARYQPEWLGHEMTHCLYGRWHSDQGR